MNFNSLAYLLFLPAILLGYYLLPQRWRNPLLLLGSYFFYMCWRPEYALLILFSTAATYFCARLITACPQHKKGWLAGSLVVNLAILFCFKYFSFAAGLINAALQAAGLAISAPALDLLLPVGISFYTFQALGYTIDVYRGQTAAESNFATYALFVSFFPQLVAGPIERSANLLPQFKEQHRFDPANLSAGLLPLLWGFFKKLVIADQLAVLVNTVYAAPDNFLPSQLAIATVAFAFQIYCDFSAYSDIARGSALMLGFRLMRNFDAPYFSRSIAEFWRRWHISLSTWFRDYLYFPLGGSRCSRYRHLLNLLLVFVISGLWHGAALTFLAWGLLHGLYQVLSLLTAGVRARLRAALRVKETLVWETLRIAFTFFLVCLGWVFFRAESLDQAGQIIAALFGLAESGAGQEFSWLAMGQSRSNLAVAGGGILLLLGADLAERRYQLSAWLRERPYTRYLVYFMLLALMLLVGSYGQGYDPQDFVYFQF